MIRERPDRVSDPMKPLSAIILAAGKGTRMQSDLPKVAHAVAGMPMVCWVARACAEAGCSRIVIVVGYQREVVRQCLADFAPAGVEVQYAVQAGHAETRSQCVQPFAPSHVDLQI